MLRYAFIDPKKIFLLGLWISLAGASSTLWSAKPTELKDPPYTVAISSDNRPYSYHDEKGALVGFEIDLIQEIAKIMEIRVDTLRILHFAGIISAVDEGRVDMAIASIKPTQKRAQFVDFSIPYYSEKIMLVFRKGRAIEGVDSLKNEAMGVLSGTHYPETLLQDRQIKIVFYDETNKMVQDLVNKKGPIQAIVLGQNEAKNLLSNQSLQGIELESSEESYAIAVKRGAPWLGRINAAIRELQNKGVLEALKKKWGL